MTSQKNVCVGGYPYLGSKLVYVSLVDGKHKPFRHLFVNDILIRNYYGSPTKWTFIASVLLDHGERR